LGKTEGTDSGLYNNDAKNSRKFVRFTISKNAKSSDLVKKYQILPCHASGKRKKVPKREKKERSYFFGFFYVLRLIRSVKPDIVLPIL